MNSIPPLYLIFSLENASRFHRINLRSGLSNVLRFKSWSSPVLKRHCPNITSLHNALDLNVTSTLLRCNKTPYSFMSLHSKADTETTRPDMSTPLTKQQIQDLILHLTKEERQDLETALHEYHSKKTKAEYEGQLAGVRWRSTFGRPSKLPTLGDVDPTGTYCTVPDDWLLQKYAETVPPPNTSELIKVVTHNAIPFVGFGFLDNFVMIVAGDQIDATIGSMVVLSTMAAAALGNTISDIMGIGSAWYVERLALSIGIKPPKLTPIQLDMPASRRASNLGRVLGVTLGCLLGMVPLLFIGKKKKEGNTVTNPPKQT